MTDAPTITALKPTAKDPTRWSIKVGRKYMGTLPQSEIEELGLVVGTLWTPDLASRITHSTSVDKIYRSATFRLSKRMYAIADLKRKLRMSKHQPPPEIVDEVIEKLLAKNLLDDEAYGRALIRDIQLRRPAGPRLLQTKLMQKGLNSKLIEQLIKETAADRDDFDAAMSMAKKKVNSLKRLPVQKARQRLYGQLTRRGFEYDTVSQVMENLDWDNWADGDAVDPWE
ncbi:MAG: hypothetical protein CMJ19_11630 [Phycisphaeraceae bacterium]|nr:hypothetical protein [Phycisphaeraceae bacterium]